MIGDILFKILNVTHRWVLRITRGKFGWRLLGMEVVEVTTKGRRSGAPRSVMLTSPLQEGDRVVVVASKGGDTKHPAWFLNLQSDPAVLVSRRGREARPMIARVAASDERVAIWPKVVAKYKYYESYQKRAGREIPIVFLEPDQRGGVSAEGQ